MMEWWNAGILFVRLKIFYTKITSFQRSSIPIFQLLCTIELQNVISIPYLRSA